MIRAIRYRYFARSLPGRRDQTESCAWRAAVTARLTSALEARATWESDSSVAGLITSKVARGLLRTHSLLMKRPYSRRMSMWSVDSGAAAYSQGMPRFERPHEAGAGRLSGFLTRVTRPIIAPRFPVAGGPRFSVDSALSPREAPADAQWWRRDAVAKIEPSPGRPSRIGCDRSVCDRNGPGGGGAEGRTGRDARPVRRGLLRAARSVDRPKLSPRVRDAGQSRRGRGRRRRCHACVPGSTSRHSVSRHGSTPGSAGSWPTCAGIGCGNAATALPSSPSIRPAPSIHSRNPSSTRHCEEALAAISPEHRAVVALHYLEGMTVEQIAEHVGTREGTVKSRLHYGVAELRAAYDAASRDPGRTLR